MPIRARPLLVLLSLALAVSLGCQSLRDWRASAWQASAPLTDGGSRSYAISKDGKSYRGMVTVVTAESRRQTWPIEDPQYRQKVFTGRFGPPEAQESIRLRLLEHTEAWVRARDEGLEQDLEFTIQR